MTSPWRIWTRTGSTASAARSRAWSVSSGLNDEFGTTSGLMSSRGEHPLGCRRGRRPSARPAGSASRRPRCRAARCAAWRRGRARPRSGPPPSARRRAPTRVGLRRLGQVRDGRLEQGRALLGRQVGRERPCRPGATRSLEGELLLGGDGDRLLGGEVVLRLDGRRGRRRAPRSVRTSLSKSIARGATMSRGARSPAVDRSGSLGQDVGARGSRSATRIRMPGRDRRAATASLRVKRAMRRGALGQHGCRRRHGGLSGSRRRGRRGRRWRGPGRPAR